MPAAPQILPTQITQGTAPGLNYSRTGALEAVRRDPSLAPPAALEAAKGEG